MYCSKCGAYISDNSDFCSKCGEQINITFDAAIKRNEPSHTPVTIENAPINTNVSINRKNQKKVQTLFSF